MLTATTTPQPKELQGKPFYSPDGEWSASSIEFSKGNQSYLSLIVEKTDSSIIWEAETIPIENEPQYLTHPVPFLWSKDGKTLYFVDRGYGDGCFSYGNGGEKLHSLNLDNGERKTILDEFTSQIEFSPDESKIAYVPYWAGLKILDLQNGNQIEFKGLYPGVLTAQNGLVWSPDGNQLAFTILLDACITDRATTIVIVDVSQNSQRIVVKENENLFFTKEWIDENRILVDSWSGKFDHLWYLNPKTGELTSVNQ